MYDVLIVFEFEPLTVQDIRTLSDVPLNDNAVALAISQLSLFYDMDIAHPSHGVYVFGGFLE